MNILLIDDDIIDRKIIKRALQKTQDVHQLVEVSSAMEGLAAVEKQSFDILLVDYRMPEIDGIELVIELRGRAKLNSTAIVMISTISDENLAISCLQSGAQDFICKDEVSPARLKRAMIQAQTRFELERRLYDSFLQVRELAEKDSLTGLSNRYCFEDALKVSIANNKRTDNIIALLLLDLDHFKNINDTYGHETGDKLLQYVTRQITQCLRDNELFARLGGDEFAILVTGLFVAHDATLVANRIIKALEVPIKIDGHNLQCGVSIGIALHTKNNASAEELIRWPNCTLQSFPDEFIPIAEQTRLIEKIGEWVLDNAIAQLAVWHKKYDKSLTMAINLSPVQLAIPSLTTFISTRLDKHGVAPASIILELTETALFGKEDINQKNINQLHAIGVKLALDDFGTGFSSLSHLVNFPISIVKLDKSLLPASSQESRHLTIVKGVAAMVNIIGLRTVAEGVETEFQANLCDVLEIDELQGYYFSKPMSASEIEFKWLK